MDKAVVVKRSFAEAESAEKEYYQRLTPLERLAILLELNRHWMQDNHADSSQRSERVYRIIKRA